MRASVSSVLAILAVSVLAAAPAYAKDHGQGHGKGHGKDHDQGEQHERHEARNIAPGAYFDDHHREAVRTYYVANEGKRCPPGLAKKHNGCMPPGQARKWHVGERLPTTVVYAPVPQPVLVQLPPVPVGYRYVNVSGDVLLIATGTRMVMDGINGLMR